LPGLAKRIQELKSIIAKLNIEAANFASASERVFEHAQKLSQALQRQAEIDEALEIDADDKSALALSQD
jgi:prefoldin subunit 5